jgi:hypothetical protein
MTQEEKEYLLAKINCINEDNVHQAINDLKYVLDELVRAVLVIRK